MSVLFAYGKQNWPSLCMPLSWEMARCKMSVFTSNLCSTGYNSFENILGLNSKIAWLHKRTHVSGAKTDPFIFPSYYKTFSSMVRTERRSVQYNWKPMNTFVRGNLGYMERTSGRHDPVLVYVLLGLLSRCPVIKASHCSPLEDQARKDII